MLDLIAIIIVRFIVYGALLLVVTPICLTAAFVVALWIVDGFFRLLRI